jgi:hypothetical protein
MKQIFTFLFFPFLLLPLIQAQDLQSKGILQVALAADFNSYFMALEEQDFDLALDYVFPGLFDLIPRELMQESLEIEATDGENEIKMTNAKIQLVKGIEEDEGHFYAMISYAYTLEIKSGTVEESGDSEEEEEEEWESDEMDIDDYRRKYGVRNVTYDATNKLIKVKRTGNMFAVQSKDEFDDDGWKFVEIKDEMQPIIDQLIPPGILTKLKS